jgi:hypothetical protein
LYLFRDCENALIGQAWASPAPKLEFSASLFQSKDEPEGSEGLAKRGSPFF